MKTISDKIFELLKEKGMSQKEFAQRTGIAESSIRDRNRNVSRNISKIRYKCTEKVDRIFGSTKRAFIKIYQLNPYKRINSEIRCKSGGLPISGNQVTIDS